MKKPLVVLAVAFQLLSVAWVAASREILLLSGEPVVLQTAPIDPRDIFRGDYVRLSYLFNQVQPEQLSDDIRINGLAKGDPVYLRLEPQEVLPATAGKLQTQKPDSGLFLAGRVSQDWQPTRRVYAKKQSSDLPNNQPVSIAYGIERYYVQQGKGKEIETIRGLHNPQRERFQRPMLIQARVSRSGKAGIESYRWGKLAFKTAIIKQPDPKAGDEAASAIMEFALQNVSGHPLVLPLKPGNCSFQLKPSGRDFDPQKQLQTGRDECLSAEASPTTLKPDEIYSMEFDLNNPAWRFEQNNKLLPLGKLPWDHRMRIHYIEPLTRDLDTAIISRAFHGRGNID